MSNKVFLERGLTRLCGAAKIRSTFHKTSEAELTSNNTCRASAIRGGKKTSGNQDDGHQHDLYETYPGIKAAHVSVTCDDK